MQGPSLDSGIGKRSREADSSLRDNIESSKPKGTNSDDYDTEELLERQSVKESAKRQKAVDMKESKEVKSASSKEQCQRES